MTQLNLSGGQSNNPQQKPIAKHEDESIKNQTVGALGALAMFAAVIVIGSCSRSSKPVAVQQPLKPEVPVSAPAVAAPAPVTAPTPVVAKARKRRAATLSYVNHEYGLSFNFPRNYRLQTQLKPGTGNAVPMNFVHPGGKALAAVELPANSYPGTDFKSGFVNVNVNQGMTSEACAQFASPEMSTGAGTETSQEVKTSEVKLGAIEFHEVENSAGAAMKQSDARYYHVFGNGACYEFALGVGTDSDGNVEEVTPVDRKDVFGKLEKILATVKLQPVTMPETRITEAQSPEAHTSESETLKAETPVPAEATPTENTAHTPEKNPGQDQEKSAPVPNF